jgi:hypothetical protein
MSPAEVCTTVRQPVGRRARCYEGGDLTMLIRGEKEGLLTIRGLHQSITKAVVLGVVCLLRSVVCSS